VVDVDAYPAPVFSAAVGPGAMDRVGPNLCPVVLVRGDKVSLVRRFDP
jgi:hypothetical protein